MNENPHIRKALYHFMASIACLELGDSEASAHHAKASIEAQERARIWVRTNLISKDFTESHGGQNHA